MTDIKDRSIKWITGVGLLTTFALVGVVATADLLITSIL